MTHYTLGHSILFHLNIKKKIVNFLDKVVLGEKLQGNSECARKQGMFNFNANGRKHKLVPRVFHWPNLGQFEHE